MKKSIQFQLSFMMFLEFFIWGAWFVTLGTFMGNNLSATGAETGMAYSTQSWGAIIAPFIIGLIADRFFNAEKILGVLHIIGAILMYMMFQANDFTTFYPYVLGYMIAYMPTLALVNSVAFKQMKDPAKEFSFIRVWGTIGWILAGLLISYYFHWDSKENAAAGMLQNTFLMTAIVSVVLGVFSFFLPKTPPSISKEDTVTISSILGIKKEEMLKGADPADDLLEMDGMDETTAKFLAINNIKTMEDLAEAATDELLEIEGLNIDQERAESLIMTARRPWFLEMGIDPDAEDESEEAAES